MGELVNVTVTDALATIRLDRPPMNAVNTRMQVEFSEAAAVNLLEKGRAPTSTRRPPVELANGHARSAN